MNLTPLKYLLLIENVTAVFRNYWCYKKKCSRIFIIVWVLIETLNISSNAVDNLARGNTFFFKAQRIYFFSSIGFSIYIMIASLYYSKRFHELLLNFDAFYKIFDDNVYNKRMMKAQKEFTIMVVSFCGLKILVFTFVRITNSYGDGGLGLVGSTLYQYNISTADFRYTFQYFILHSILFVISEQLKVITRSIESELSAVRDTRGNVENAELLSNIAINRDKFNKWVKAYQNVKDNSNLCNSMFSIQLTIMLLIVTAYYIILLYSIALSTVEGIQTVSSLLMNLFSIVVFLMAVFVISRAGQKVQNSSMQLQQKLCELCVHTLENEEYYKLTKDLLRCVRTRPVRVHVFGTLDVNMSMLPSIVAFFTSYTVIALQFNNVL